MQIRLVIAGAVLGLLLAATLAFFLNRPPAPVIGPHSDDVKSAPDVDEIADLSSSAPLERLTRPDEHFAGAAACAECHADVSASFQGHAMARSLGDVMTVAPVENSQSTEFNPDGRRIYRVERTDKGVWHHEVLRDSAGETLYDLAVPVQFEVGSGHRGRSYLTNRDGLMFMSPITWYTGQARWDLSPGYEPGNHAGFQRRISDGCLACHAGRVAADTGHTDRYDPARPFIEPAIGCERCHGPGGEHVGHRRDATADDAARAGAAPDIVNPARLEPAARDAVCNQCHLQGARRVLRFGRSEFDFRPGMLLSEIWTVFLKSTGEAEGQDPGAVSQYELMRESACFKNSQGRLSCTSCHDPHSLPSAVEKPAYYRAKCVSCHGDGAATCSESPAKRQALAPGDSCIACHVPSFNAADVPHTALSDHRIPRRSRPAPPAVQPKSPMRLPEMFVETGSALPPLEVQRARGILMSELAGRPKKSAPGDTTLADKALRLLEGVLAAGHRDPDVLLAVGTCHRVRERLPEARAAWEQTLELDPENEEALEKMAILHHTLKEPLLARGYYERLVEVNPYRAEYWGRLAHIRGLLGQPQRAIAAANRALELNPSLLQIHQWLAGVYEGLKKPEQSQQHVELYEKLSEALLAKPPATP